MTIGKLALCLILSFASEVCRAQSVPKFQAENLQEDFRILRAALEEAHPGIYWYRTKSEMDSAFDRTYRSLDHDMDELEFFRLIASVISRIGCGHTWIATTDQTQERIWGSGKVLPLKLTF